MTNWKKLAGILCVVGFFKEFIPSEPFLLEYAVEHGNFTAEEFTHDILPVTTYTTLASLLLIIVLNKCVHYKPVIVVGGLTAISTWCITIWLYHTITLASLRQIMEAISSSTEVAYFTYIYAKVHDKRKYKKVTTFLHCAGYLGKCVGAIVGQVSVSILLFSLNSTNYLSLFGTVMYFGAAVCLPRVKHGDEVYEQNEVGSIQMNSRYDDHVDHGKKWRRSIWWWFALPVYLQVKLYSECLWDSIGASDETLKNMDGWIEASHALLSTLVAIGLIIWLEHDSNFVHSLWDRWGECCLSLVSILQGVLIWQMSQTHNLTESHVYYVIFKTLFQVFFIVTSAEVARCGEKGEEAWMFGVNYFVALLIQSLLTFVFAGNIGLQMEIRDEFRVYGTYSLVLGGTYFIGACLYWCMCRRHVVPDRAGETLQRET